MGPGKCNPCNNPIRRVRFDLGATGSGKRIAYTRTTPSRICEPNRSVGVLETLQTPRPAEGSLANGLGVILAIRGTEARLPRRKGILVVAGAAVGRDLLAGHHLTACIKAGIDRVCPGAAYNRAWHHAPQPPGLRPKRSANLNRSANGPGNSAQEIVSEHRGAVYVQDNF